MNTFFENKRIAIFSAETIPSFAGGGRHAFHLAAYLRWVGASPSVVCYNYNGQLNRKDLLRGVRICRMLYYNRYGLEKVISSVNLIRHYFVEALQNDILIIYGKYLIAYPIIVLFGKLFRKQVVYRSTLFGEDDFESLRQNAKWRWPILRFVLSKVDCFWAINSKIAATWSIVRGRGVLLEMPQCIDESVFGINSEHKKQGQKIDKKGKRLNILSCGILIERKGYREIFEALSKVNIEFNYTVVGQFQPDIAHRSSPKEQGEMKMLLEFGKQTLGDKVVFVGTSDNMLPYFSDADVFLHASDTERPNVVLEAMASGIPVICRKMKNALDEIVKDKVNCLLFENDKELVAMVNSLPMRTNELQQIGSNAADLMKERYSFEKLLFKLAECLKCERK